MTVTLHRAPFLLRPWLAKTAYGWAFHWLGLGVKTEGEYRHRSKS